MKKRLFSLSLALLLCLMLVPPSAAAGAAYIRLSAGADYALGVRTDGSLWLLAPGSAPRQIMSDVARAAVGPAYSLVVKADGTLWMVTPGQWEQPQSLMNNVTYAPPVSGSESGSSPSATPPPSPVYTVTVSPNTATVNPGASLQFTSSVNAVLGTSVSVTWSVSSSTPGTSIDAGGLLTVAPGETAATLTVTATSAADTSKFGTATVTVNQAPSARLPGGAVPPAAFAAVGDFLPSAYGSPQTNTSSIAPGAVQSYVIRGDGALWRFTPVSDPERVMTSVTSVSTSAAHTLAIRHDAVLYAFTDDPQNPTKIMELATSTSAGKDISYAVRADGSLWSFTADGALTQLDDHMLFVTSCDTHALALRFDGGLYRFSAGAAPVKVMDGVKSAAAGNFLSFATTGNGSLWAFTDGGTPFEVTESTVLPGTAAQPSAPPVIPSATALPTPQRLYLSGTEIFCEGYNIGGNNYFKLRDLAQAMNGTLKYFDVTYESGAVRIVPGRPYVPVGNELRPGDGKTKSAVPTNDPIQIASAGTYSPAGITAYKIAGTNFVRLVDVMRLLNVNVEYNAASNTVRLDPFRPYSG
jgi:hypothetical protein